MSGTSGFVTPRERVARLVAQGRMSIELVESAISFWQEEQLVRGVTIPSGEIVIMSEADLYHVIIDDRILRRPDRIRRILEGVFEICTSQNMRRVALSTWDEEGRIMNGIVVLDPDNHVRTMPVVDARKIRKEQRKGDLIWLQ